MNVLFLDYDGVVNNIIWGPNGERANYNHPGDGKVNDYQAVQWISEFCTLYNYSIVVISSWIRITDKWKECLINGGLREGIEILGCIDLNTKDKSAGIKKWLDEHEDVESWIIVDDEDIQPTNHLVSCGGSNGFYYHEFRKAEQLHHDLIDFNHDKKVEGCDSFFDGIVLHLKDETRISIKYEELIDYYYSR